MIKLKLLIHILVTGQKIKMEVTRIRKQVGMPKKIHLNMVDGGPHWDIKPPRGSGHVNVGPDGNIFGGSH